VVRQTMIMVVGAAWFGMHWHALACRAEIERGCAVTSVPSTACAICGHPRCTTSVVLYTEVTLP
jgi:hypothetical protein